MKKRLLTAALAVCLGASCSALTLMSYNVQNLFDDVRDGTEYREFDPGRAKWGTEMFKLRIDAIADVVRRARPGGPDILLLQEVENENALRALREQGLKGMGYAWSVIVPREGSPANVAILSRLPIARVRSHAVAAWKGKVPVRDVLEAQLEIQGHTLYLFNNHWKAKTGGVKSTESSRLQSAAVLARRITEILATEPAADIVAAGDFNESSDEYDRVHRAFQTALMPAGRSESRAVLAAGIFLSAEPGAARASGEGCILYDPWAEIESAPRGSYAYQGEWLTVDHALLSEGLFDQRGFAYRPGSFEALRLAFLLTPKGLPRKWTGRAGDRGYSDHLPLLLTLDLRN